MGGILPEEDRTERIASSVTVVRIARLVPVGADRRYLIVGEPDQYLPDDNQSTRLSAALY
jgi:hypothetical protein